MCAHHWLLRCVSEQAVCDDRVHVPGRARTLLQRGRRCAGGALLSYMHLFLFMLAPCLGGPSPPFAPNGSQANHEPSTFFCKGTFEDNVPVQHQRGCSVLPNDVLHSCGLAPAVGATLSQSYGRYLSSDVFSASPRYLVKWYWLNGEQTQWLYASWRSGIECVWYWWLWAVGVGGKWKQREQAARLAPCVALAANMEEPAARAARVRWISLSASAPLVLNGLPDLGPCIVHDPELQNMMSSGSYILSDTGVEGDAVVLTHDTDWELYPEVGEAVKAATDEDRALCVAVCTSANIWAPHWLSARLLGDGGGAVCVCGSVIG